MKDDPGSLGVKIIEQEIKELVERQFNKDYPLLGSILAYHFGWRANGVGSGKKVRPKLLLMTCDALGGNWEKAINAGVAIELIHNFSLIHDDIQDQSDYRHGRHSTWREFGIAQAINAGDALLACAYQAAGRLEKDYSNDRVQRISTVLANACSHLIGGQSLDLQYEHLEAITQNEYKFMIGGKTAALFSACTEISALLSVSEEKIVKGLAEFGKAFGIAFQIQDDWLGIWGNVDQLGKSTESDLKMGKKTLPIIYGLEKKGKFFSAWRNSTPSEFNITLMTALLQEEGAKKYTEEMAASWFERSIRILEPFIGRYPKLTELIKFCSSLVKRNN